MPSAASRSILLLVVMSSLYYSDLAFAQGRHVDVMVTIVKDKIVALPGNGSPVEEALGVNEAVITTAARGPAGFAQTSNRLLGFSSALRRWTDVPLGIEERVERHEILPRLLVVQTNRRVYGFQESRGHWFTEALGPNEIVKQMQGQGHVVVILTSERALAFSAFTGGFVAVRWSANEQVQSLDQTNDVTVVRTTARQLAFRSQADGWIEMR